MKLGLYLVDERDTAGGAYVVREDLVQAIRTSGGRHSVTFVNGEPSSGGTATRRPSALRLLASRAIHALHLAEWRTKAKTARLREEVARKGVEMLWFNHTAPIDIGLPYIISVFDVLHRLQPWFPEVSANGIFARREAVWVNAFQRASVVIAPSEQTKADISFLYDVPMERIRVIPFPTPASALQAAKAPPAGTSMRDKYGLKRPFLFYPAQFWPHKNHVNLLHALKLLRDNHGLDFDLVLTGSDHGNLPHVRRTADMLGLSDNVHFLGFVPRGDLIELYREAFALSYVSFFGPENLPPLEAQAMGCPVVMGDMPGVRPLFGDGPFYANPNDPTAIAKAIAILANDPARRTESIARGRINAERNRPIDVIKAMLEILDDFEAIRRCWP